MHNAIRKLRRISLCRNGCTTGCTASGATWKTGSRNGNSTLFADRTSCHDWWPNQYRLPLSALACILFEAVRRIALSGSELANAHVSTICLKLLKIGAVVLRNTRRVRLLLSSSHPHQALFHSAAVRLKPG